MNEEQVARYIHLVYRKSFIIGHSGISWKPEYETEMQQINQELALLRPLVDQAHARKEIKKCPYQCTTTDKSE